MIIIIYLVIGIFILAIISDMWLFDCLVRWEYEHHYEQWVLDGKPIGLLSWRPTELNSKGWSAISGNEKCLDFKWLFRLPKWAANSLECRRWNFYRRICVCVGLLSLVVLISMLKR